MIRRSFESADLELFSGLEEGDIVLFDGSHRCYMNSDVTVFFLEVLPTLRPGILVHIHDIFLPYDYPPEWADRFYSEQYLLACYLLADNRHFEIELPNTFVAFDAELGAIVNPLWEMPNMQGVQRHGGSFWLSSR